MYFHIRPSSLFLVINFLSFLHFPHFPLLFLSNSTLHNILCLCLVSFIDLPGLNVNNALIDYNESKLSFIMFFSAISFSTKCILNSVFDDDIATLCVVVVSSMMYLFKSFVKYSSIIYFSRIVI